MWKPVINAARLNAIREFQKNLVVWKQYSLRSGERVVLVFQKNLVVWKLKIEVDGCGDHLMVSEELSSVETLFHVKDSIIA